MPLRLMKIPEFDPRSIRVGTEPVPAAKRPSQRWVLLLSYLTLHKQCLFRYLHKELPKATGHLSFQLNLKGAI